MAAASTGDSSEQPWQSFEEQIDSLNRQVDELEEGIIADPPKDLATLETENEKLKYRKKHLERSLEVETNLTISEKLTCLITTAFRTSFPELLNFEAKVVSSDKFADFQCNDALSLVGEFKKQGKNLNPRVISQTVIKYVPQNDVIDSVEIAGPGYININVKTNVIDSFVRSLVMHEKAKPPVVDKKRVIVDFSSPNIAKEMHVGHLRSTIIGDSICRLLEWVGHDVLRLNHLGDWGTQFGMLIAHLEDKFPDYLTVSPPLKDLQTFYREAKKRFDEEEDFKKRAYELVVKLQKYDPPVYKAWQMICEVSKLDFEKIYERLDINIIARGESFYQQLMDETVAELRKKSLLVEDEGRTLFFVPGAEVPLTVVKSDGGYTYDTSDLAAVRQRIKTENAEWIVYVVDSGQSLHFNTFFAAARMAGWYDPYVMRLQHVGFGVVLGEDKKKFKSRSGTTIKLTELLDEGMKRAMDTLIEKGRDKELTPEELKRAQEAVAYGCVKYADLSHNYVHDYVFSFDRMLDDKGNTAVYLLYALTRIRSIRRKANVSVEQVQQYAKDNVLTFTGEKERKLGKMLIMFADSVKRTLVDLHIHYLCDYMYQLCTTFSEFYDNCYCIEKKANGEVIIHMHRLVLCECTALIMEQVFQILGIKTVSKM
ncbi:arginine--tRNA ligase, cytoplasmic-like [Symsagittifera roscoffensis]|uniref:arginine--tRNA ligase, cytoplasmic-like n=1 Tax=Symsagittifera roscoffensis TaxID=84072 RepID=UPI00307B1D31